MQYRRYGKDGPEVSVLGFGAMRLPQRKESDWGTVNFTRATAVIRRALDAGVSFIDTHHNYHRGLSEEAIGRVLKRWKGRRIYVQTKTPFYREEPLDYFKKLIEQALTKLGVDCIDYLLFHSMNMGMFKKRGRAFFRLTDWAMKRGLIRHRGFSSHDKPENVKAFIDTGEFSAMVLSYNWFNPTMAKSLAYGAGKGLGVAVMNPIGGGALAAGTPQVRRLLPGARSGPEVALRFVLATPGVAVALSGMSTVAQVDENTRIAGRKSYMTPRQRGLMRQRLKRVKRKFQQVCTSCGYCMPCPHGVDIPQNFLLLNQARYLGLLEWARTRFGQLRKRRSGDRSALACTKCGKCLPKCPNDVPIIEQLELTAALLGA
ncbi:MAG: hypothetical protein AMJ81_13530 [Phycisphaerae bacterium SM23_33]|nr:MAG: hypothetical protein AMJ81_13530 [Phycisphaerae bacterium SM23_33]